MKICQPFPFAKIVRWLPSLDKIFIGSYKTYTQQLDSFNLIQTSAFLWQLGQTPSADEDQVLWLKALKQLPLGELGLSFTGDGCDNNDDNSDAYMSKCDCFQTSITSPYCRSCNGVSTDVWAAGCSRVEVGAARYGSPWQGRQNAVVRREHRSSVGVLGLVQDSCLNIACPG